MKHKKLFAYLLALLLLLSFAGCAAEATADRVYSKEAVPEYEMSNGLVYGDAAMAPNEAGSGKPSVAQNQKLVRNMSIRAQTQNMDPLLAGLEAKVWELGGYVENKNVQNAITSGNKTTRNADMTIRVPADVLDAFVAHIQGQSNVISLNESMDDITLKYVAVESRITALETEQQRLLELMEKAENMSDLLKIESRLTEVLTELEQTISQMRVYDNMVEYATLRLTITEVKEFTEPVEEEKTFWQRMGDGIANSWNLFCTAVTEFFLIVVVSLPILLPLGAIALGTVLLIRFLNKKHRKQKNAPPADPQ